jgi:hypothetical protein
MQKKYTGLRIISGIYRFIGFFIGGVAIIGGAVLSVIGGSLQPLVLAIPATISGLALYGFGELILLLMDMEENGRRQAALLEHLAGRRKRQE